MNDRIQELTEQAIKEADAQGLPTVQWFGQEQYYKVLVELIVRECCNACMGNVVIPKGTRSYNDGVIDCTSSIKEHFGLE